MNEVIWNSMGYDPCGYAACARDYMIALDRIGFKVKYDPLNLSPIKAQSISGKILDQLKSFELSVVSEKAPRVIHIVPDAYSRKGTRPHIGYTVFETNGCPSHWIPKMEMMDEIWVPCHFNLDTFESSGFNRKKMRVIPHVVDTELFDPDNTEPLNIPIKKEFYFLVIMDITYRKGWDVLLRAYLREFQGNKDVGLVFKGYFGDAGDKQKKQILGKLRGFKESLRIANPPDVIFFGEILDQYSMPKLYKACHCYVLPHRGEGWGLTCSNAMAMGMPTISTNWSGNLEFMHKDNSYLIDVIDFRDIEQEMIKITPNYKGHKWAEPSEIHLRHLMREVYENYSAALEKGKRARIEMIEKFSWRPIAEKLKAAINRFS